jgi:hypothetical protein
MAATQADLLTDVQDDQTHCPVNPDRQAASLHTQAPVHDGTCR